MGIIFTNGIFDNDRLIKCILRHRIPVNLNYFPKEEYKNGQFKLVHENMDRLFLEKSVLKRVHRNKPVEDVAAFSITFYKPDQQYQYIIGACQKYKVGLIR